ncbi:hypothetical protein B0H10DRAFT_1963576 [Mycena sp. CBHHK59/15]|nr:hypothetical protein B0H10DRAFT_1963576 [Mycena sp. CBHHK59/15]
MVGYMKSSPRDRPSIFSVVVGVVERYNEAGAGGRRLHVGSIQPRLHVGSLVSTDICGRHGFVEEPGSEGGFGPFRWEGRGVGNARGETYFITTNADYVPAVPSLKLPHALFLRSDMRYGTDDPTLWPQQYTGRFCHLPVIAKKVPPFVNDLVACCKELRRTSRTPISPLFGELIQNILMLLEQLQTLPTTYTKMVFVVTSLQRACLELDALYNYTTIYKPRINNYLSAPPNSTHVAQCVGAFTSVPVVAQQLYAARLPFWFLRPTFVFLTENILSVVALCEASRPLIVISSCHSIEGSRIKGHPHRKQFGSSYALTQPAPALQAISFKTTGGKHRVKGPAKTERDKFQILDVAEMPPSIAAWADALSQVDKSVSPFTIDPADRRYVFPEPALLVNTTPDRQRKFLHHWTLLRDGFTYMLSQREHSQLLSAQEWRDVLEGHMTKRGHPDSKTYPGATARGSYTPGPTSVQYH